MADIVETVVGTVASLLIGGRRLIGPLMPDIVVEEVARDATFVTMHPVEQGATISDHAVIMPVELELRCGWSDSSGGFQGYSTALYRALLLLQAARQPFSVVTPKRSYSNMLIAGLEVTTNASSEYALLVRVMLREVIITSTSTTSTSATQANPSRTSSVSNAGTKQAVPVEAGAVPAAAVG